MLLESEKIKLRALEPEDLDFLYAIENDASLWSTTSAVSPYSRYELRQYIATVPRDIYELGFLKLVIERKSDGARLGLLDLFGFDHHNSRIETGVIIAEAYRRQGYALEALNLAKEYAFDFLHLHQIYCHISSDNIASVSLFTKAGYKKTATLPDWIQCETGWVDVDVMTRINS